MTKFTSPAQVAAAVAEERRLYAAMDGFKMDVRIAERDGDDTAVTVAKRAQDDADKAWFAAWKDAQSAVLAALETVGLDAKAIKMYL